MHYMVFPWDSADGTPYREGGHGEISHEEESLREDLPTKVKKMSSCSVGYYRDEK